ncbi:hypothetical protein LCGC14_2279460 [marine sediment metagenome]|uniref:Uncharacterized protein n=1 Tax=marine sediment metagenome TaxID=412755 RepID=A0A0F9F700_9ZZZZ
MKKLLFITIFFLLFSVSFSVFAEEVSISRLKTFPEKYEFSPEYSELITLKVLMMGRVWPFVEVEGIYYITVYDKRGYQFYTTHVAPGKISFVVEEHLAEEIFDLYENRYMSVNLVGGLYKYSPGWIFIVIRIEMRGTEGTITNVLE